MTSLYVEYFDYFKKCVQEYGNNVAVLMEVGKFYEVYEIINETEHQGNATLLASILNIQLTKKDKKKPECSIKNPLMIGVPTMCIDKYTKILINNNYTIVVINQEKLTGNKIIRNITNTISVGTYIDSDKDSNNMVCVFIDSITENNVIAGFSSVDITTGECVSYEVGDNQEYVLNELYRLIHTYKPVEMLYVDVNKVIKDPQYKFDLNNVHLHKIDKMSEIKDQINVNYQNVLLGKIYKSEVLTPIEYINLESHPTALTTFVLVCNFVYKHNETILSFLQVPTLIEETSQMIIESNAMYQLDLIHLHSSQNKSLFELLAKTITPMGRRMFKKILLNPINKIEEINKRYDHIDIFTKDNIQRVRKLLGEYRNDQEKMYRKLQLNVIHPYEVSQLVQCINKTSGLLEIDPIDFTRDDKHQLKQFIDEYHSIFLDEEMARFNRDQISSNIFVKGYCEDADKLATSILDLYTKINNIKDILCGVIKVGGSVRVEQNDKDGIYLETTYKRANMIKAFIESPDGDRVKIMGLTFKTTPSKSASHISSPEIEQISHRLIRYKNQLSKVCLDNMDKYCNLTTNNNYNSILLKFFKTIALIDHYSTCAHNANIYRYSRPVLKSGEKSSISAKELRHPLIEIINTSEIYVPNDISIGVDYNGFLLYGTNACGKSSLMKAVGLCIIMAQAGMYVPCKSLELAPYNSLYTRIDGNDNLYKGDSSFAVEMKELRTILNRANNKTIVLGDEVCKGTEHVSATSLIAASIYYMTTTSNCSFVFATHIHDLANIDYINSNNFIKFFHLSISRSNNKITYNRKLKDGIGDSIYGLEVARAMKLNQTVLDIANNVRNKLLNKDNLIMSTKTSRYNSKKYVDNCEMCGSKGEHTHHINHQADADDDGYIEHFHKNHLANLMILCESCHHKIHNI